MTALLELHPAAAGLEVLKGRKKICYRWFVRSTSSLEAIILPPLSAVLISCLYLGLKPQAQSYYPFGICPTAAHGTGRLFLTYSRQ